MCKYNIVNVDRRDPHCAHNKSIMFYSLVGSSVVTAPLSSAKSSQKQTAQTKDDAYDDFMKEIEGIM